MPSARTCLHEAGHQVVGDVLGWRSNGVTVAGGEYSLGVSRSLPPLVPAGVFDELDASRPLVTWPEPLRRLLETKMIKLMAGDIALELLAEPEGRQPDPPAERLAELVEKLPEPDEDVQAEFTALVNDPGGESDEDQAAKQVWAAHGGDLASAARWLEYLERQCRQIVLAEAPRIRHLAAVLELRQTLTGEAVAAVLRERL